MNRKTKRVAVTMGTTEKNPEKANSVAWAPGSISECVVTNGKESFFFWFEYE